MSAVTHKRDLQEKITVDWAERINRTAYKGFDAHRMAAGLAQAAAKDPALLECTPASMFLALSNIARWGLDIGDGAHLVWVNAKTGPKGQEQWVRQAQAWPDYRGLKALAMRQGIVRRMEEFVVYEGDEFDRTQGLSETLYHKPCPEAKRGKITGAYTIITLPFQSKTFHYLPIGEIEQVRAKSKSWGPKFHTDCPPWYAMKTVCRNWLNRQPKTGVLGEALRHDDTEEIPEGEIEVPVASGAVAPAALPEETGRRPIPRLGAGDDLDNAYSEPGMNRDLQLDQLLTEQEADDV